MRRRPIPEDWNVGATVIDTEYMVLPLPSIGSSSGPSTSFDCSSGAPMANATSCIWPFGDGASATSSEPSASSMAARISAGGVRRAGSYTWYSMSRIAGRWFIASPCGTSRYVTGGVAGAAAGAAGAGAG